MKQYLGESDLNGDTKDEIVIFLTRCHMPLFHISCTVSML